MAASIMGWIRQAALGDPLMPYEKRVERALQRILASRSWSKPQRDWLQRIANQTKAITIVDREALDDDLLFFKREGGGWPRLNRVFGGELAGCAAAVPARGVGGVMPPFCVPTPNAGIVVL